MKMFLVPTTVPQSNAYNRDGNGVGKLQSPPNQAYDDLPWDQIFNFHRSELQAIVCDFSHIKNSASFAGVSKKKSS